MCESSKRLSCAAVSVIAYHDEYSFIYFTATILPSKNTLYTRLEPPSPTSSAVFIILPSKLKLLTQYSLEFHQIRHSKLSAFLAGSLDESTIYMQMFNANDQFTYKHSCTYFQALPDLNG